MAMKFVGVRKFLALAVIASISFSTSPTEAKNKSVRKVQEVDFDEMSLKGTIRNPDGAYLVQKKGLKFLPLHQIKKDMDAKIRESSFYVK
jgi:hypothetical protein